MAEEELLTLDGQIDEILPDDRFGVTVENSLDKGRIISRDKGPSSVAFGGPLQKQR